MRAHRPVISNPKPARTIPSEDGHEPTTSPGPALGNTLFRPCGRAIRAAWTLVARSRHCSWQIPLDRRVRLSDPEGVDIVPYGPPQFGRGVAALIDALGFKAYGKIPRVLPSRWRRRIQRRRDSSAAELIFCANNCRGDTSRLVSQDRMPVSRSQNYGRTPLH
jgi:hypothetical protein